MTPITDDKLAKPNPFDEIDLWDWTNHPLAKQFSKVMQQVEALGASPAHTDALNAITVLRQSTQDALNDAFQRFRDLETGIAFTADDPDDLEPRS